MGDELYVPGSPTDWTGGFLDIAIIEKYGFDPDGVVCSSGETEVISMTI